MKCQILFSKKKIRKYFKMFSAEVFTQHAKYLSEMELTARSDINVITVKNPFSLVNKMST